MSVINYGEYIDGAFDAALDTVIRKKIPVDEKELLALLKEELEQEYNVQIGRVENDNLGLVLVAWEKKNNKIVDASIFKVVYNLSNYALTEFGKEDTNDEDIEKIIRYTNEMDLYMKNNLPKNSNAEANKRFAHSYVFYVTDRYGYLQNMLEAYFDEGLIEDYEKEMCEEIISKQTIRNKFYFRMYYEEFASFSSYNNEWHNAKGGLQVF